MKCSFSCRYGDITPVSIVGKIFSMFWSVAGLILCGFLTGSLSTLLTASENPLAASSAPKSGVSCFPLINCTVPLSCVLKKVSVLNEVDLHLIAGFLP